MNILQKIYLFAFRKIIEMFSDLFWTSNMPLKQRFEVST